MRVQVMSSDKSKDLGLGTLTEHVTVYLYVAPDGSLASSSDAEKKPSDEAASALEAAGCVPYKIEGNPKIVLDDGNIVYGCQVWWSSLPERE